MKWGSVQIIVCKYISLATTQTLHRAERVHSLTPKQTLVQKVQLYSKTTAKVSGTRVHTYTIKSILHYYGWKGCYAGKKPQIDWHKKAWQEFEGIHRGGRHFAGGFSGNMKLFDHNDHIIVLYIGGKKWVPITSIQDLTLVSLLIIELEALNKWGVAWIVVIEVP